MMWFHADVTLILTLTDHQSESQSVTLSQNNLQVRPLLKNIKRTSCFDYYCKSYLFASLFLVNTMPTRLTQRRNCAICEMSDRGRLKIFCDLLLPYGTPTVLRLRKVAYAYPVIKCINQMTGFKFSNTMLHFSCCHLWAPPEARGVQRRQSVRHPCFTNTISIKR